MTAEGELGLEVLKSIILFKLQYFYLIITSSCIIVNENYSTFNFPITFVKNLQALSLVICQHNIHSIGLKRVM